ncbi:hypothetical protein EDD37DRAFT_656632 [Exophiala viscosa]|uniref:uncharacterized protein n=1 Tax=Exophiala viscosa TaxID=2486360 RepID=UPI00219E7619|nr:hypothetical protein EDD37DRAFT_656632 [Exophiala viscosa]
MRLLHTTRLVFQEFFDADIPSYIILSHRWLHDEVSYQNFILGRKKSSQGYAKILGSCRQASRRGNGKDPLSTEEPERSHGWLFADHRHSTEWVWIDTCCIDKSSSAELSEAINSMYRWYSNAKCCHVYLHDVVKSEIPDNTMAQFKNSEWFTRGWTLQELLAPKDVIFFDKNWMELGDKITLSRKISRATLISDWHLLSFSPSTVRVAEKMQWMANRKTSRVEDEAYCLLGLFDINMPLLYGEGHNASRRLQQEILPTSDDESIFAWEHPTMMITSVLSSHLDQFGFKCDERHDGEYSAVAGVSRPPYTITNKGLKIKPIVLGTIAGTEL